MKKQGRGLNRYNDCMMVGDPWTAKQTHWKSEANEDHKQAAHCIQVQYIYF